MSRRLPADVPVATIPVMARPGPLLRLVHSLERRRAGRTFTLAVTVRRPGLRPDTDVVIGSARVESHGPRAVVVGTGERVDVAVGGGASPLPGGMSSQAGDGIMPRHLALLVVPLPNGTLLRAISLHPERGFAVLPVEARVPDVAALEQAIRDYLDEHNKKPKPFAWTATADTILERVATVCKRTFSSAH